MKTLCFSCLMTILLIFLSCTSGSREEHNKPDFENLEQQVIDLITQTETEIRNIEYAEHQAVLNSDTVTLTKIWSPDFMVNAPSNRITLGSQEVIDLVKAGVIKYSSFTREIEEILMKGDIAISMGSEEIVPVDSGQVIKRRYTNIWMYREGEWKLIARHANVISRE